MTEDDIVLAGELALGVLDGDDRAAALRRVLAEPAFAAQVERWRAHFAVLFAEEREVAPPAGVEHRLMARLGGRATIRRWQVATLVASLAACLLLVVALPRHAAPVAPAVPTRASLLVAALDGEKGKPYNAIYDRTTGEVAVIGAAAWPDDRSAELWVIQGKAAPRPVGPIGRGASVRVSVPDEVRAAMAAGATLAVSIEPVGGSPTGLPTGPVVASGALVAV